MGDTRAVCIGQW